MKKWIFMALVLVIAACNNTENEESIKQQISQYKKQVNDLNLKIGELEKKLNSIDASDNNAFKVPVEVQDLKYETFEHFIEVSGSAEAVNEANISAEMSGLITNIFVDEGQYVQKGQLLAKLSTEITDNTINEVKGNLNLATVVYEKQKRLWEKGIGSEIQYLNAKNGKESLEKRLETLNAQLDMAMLKAPVSGVVDEIYKKKGELAIPGVPMMVVINLEEIYINADVSESYLAEVKEGDIVDVEFPTYPELKMNAPVYRKGNMIKPSNRTFTIQLRLNNPERLLKPNLLAVIHIKDYSSDSALVVPSIIIKQDMTGSYLYITEAEGNKTVAKKVYVETGMSYGDITMVKNGLKPGQKVIVQGYNQVTDGSEVKLNSSDVS